MRHTKAASTEPRTASREPPRRASDALWYKDAVIYELHVRAFNDSNGDGIGDFRGLVQRLDYLADLGVTAIWLLPFYPSPLKDDGYDIASYKSINPDYGTLRDFKQFLRAANRAGLRVITELVVNHTSDQHEWFQRARRAAPGSSSRNYYVWSDNPDRYPEARIIFKDFEGSNWAWDSVADQYYWHRFYSHQPDLNFESPDVRQALVNVMDFWLDMGVDGLRLDAVPYLFERQGTNCENLPETFAYLHELRRHVDARFPDRMLLAEANQWPEDAAAYFGAGDRCHMAFHFPLMPRMFMAIQMEDRFPVIDILAQTPQIPEASQWALFLRNHDELTLEMVTDEERDYMYRVYARDPRARLNLGIRHRLAPLLGNNRRVIEMMNGLLFSLPGTPVIYYGDEIGMGDNIYLGDRNGVRTPMQWSADRNAGFSRANPQQLYLPIIIDPEYSAAAINVEAQQGNPHSLLWWMKRLIALRKRYRAFGRGSLEFLFPENRKVLAFLRRYRDELILVIANLSRFVQYVELDLSAHRGMRPVELFGQTEFPEVGDLPYFLTLGPHAFYWFSLETQSAALFSPGEAGLPTVEVDGPWTRVLEPRNRSPLEALLPHHLRSQRWFGGKSRRIKACEIIEAIAVPGEGAPAGIVSEGLPAAGYLVLVRVDYLEGDPEVYALPLAATPVDRTADLNPRLPVVARLLTESGEQFLFDGVWDPAFCSGLLDVLARRRRLKGSAGYIQAWSSPRVARLRRTPDASFDPAPLQGEQSNTSVVFGDRLVLKLFRRTEEGVNPDLEIGRFLTERAAFPYVPPVEGSFQYVRGRSRPITLGVLSDFIPNEGDAWRYTLDVLKDYLEQVLALTPAARDRPPLPKDGRLVELAKREPPRALEEMAGSYLDNVRLLGRRTAEMHLALASDTNDPDFAPEPFSALYQRSMYQSMRTLTANVFGLLRRRADSLSGAAQILDLEPEVLRHFRSLLDLKITASRIRCHRDLHLGQVLYTGKDFVLIDFEGEPARSLSERRLKRSALVDVTGMIRSFHYAAYTSLFGEYGIVRHEDHAEVEPWIRLWYLWTSAGFLRSYLETASGATFVPSSDDELRVLSNALLLEKALYELQYEANNRPEWLKIPIQGIVQFLEAAD
ncbi:MAG: maltose alpha-D-glucosyltransferase [Actinobacteria bacterium]|nr:maltose alpha-D-glucosyltransferase [Actinomycetota bacterium]